jgi:predicted peptidase
MSIISRSVSFILCLTVLLDSAFADEKPAPGKQVEQTWAAKGDAKTTARYLLFLPKDYGKDPKKKWPMIYFLHGRGESYGPLSLVKKWGPPKRVEKSPNAPYIVVSPQCPGRESWRQPRQLDILTGLLDDVVKNYRVDADRIYLTGLSMGGYGSWALAARMPQRFAAVAPICGGGRVEDAKKLVNLPIWVWHGDSDPAVPLKRSQEMVEAIRKAGGKRVRLTTLEHIGHNSWSAAYATPELYAWMNQQRASKNKP